MKVVALVGMAGSGKSEAARIFVENNYHRIRFGDITDAGIKSRNLVLNEKNEREIREELRREHGMAAYAKLNLPKITAALERSNVIVDGLYSWEEYLLLKATFQSDFYAVAVWSSPATRYRRLAQRRERPLSPEEAIGRDKNELEKINKGAPIAMADFTVINESTVTDLKKQVQRIIELIK